MNAAEQIAEVIDRVKTDERNLDTDEYVGMILDIVTEYRDGLHVATYDNTGDGITTIGLARVEEES